MTDKCAKDIVRYPRMRAPPWPVGFTDGYVMNDAAGYSLRSLARDSYKRPSLVHPAVKALRSAGSQ